MSSGRFLAGKWRVTFEHRYQTVLESSQEIQHCPVRCPQRPRCASARGQGQTPGAQPWAGGVQVERGEDPWVGKPKCSSLLSLERGDLGLKTRDQGWRCCQSARWPTCPGAVSGPPRGPGWAFALQSPLLWAARPTPAGCGGSTCWAVAGRARYLSALIRDHCLGGAQCSRRTPFTLGGREGALRHAWAPGRGHLCAPQPHLGGGDGGTLGG